MTACARCGGSGVAVTDRPWPVVRVMPGMTRVALPGTRRVTVVCECVAERAADPAAFRTVAADGREGPAVPFVSLPLALAPPAVTVDVMRHTNPPVVIFTAAGN